MKDASTTNIPLDAIRQQTGIEVYHELSGYCSACNQKADDMKGVVIGSYRFRLCTPCVADLKSKM